MSTRTLAAALALLVSSVTAQTELTTNGGFETGSFAGWQLFPSQAGNITIGAGNGSTFGADVDNTLPASASVLKHNNLGIGQVMPGQTVTISVDVRGVTAIGGLVFVQLFSEVSGGGVSAAQLFGPIFADPNPATWTTFTFMTNTGPDVSGGVTVQLEAVTGGATGSVAQVAFDNVSVTIMSTMVTYPGSGDDLELTTGVNGPTNGTDVKSAAGGDTLTVNVASPGGSYDLNPYTLVVQAISTAGGVPNLGSLGLGDIYLDLALPYFFVVDATSTAPTGPLVIGAGTGSDHTFVLPPALNGLAQSLVFQSLVASSATSNGVYAITNAHEIIIP
jgi:hypothetical protein